MASNSKPRQPRLRASCDGCFLAKVKCSKARPICSRCLACGIDCRYSPSSRAGKPKADHSSNNASTADLAMPAVADGKNMAFPPQQPSLYKIETGWHTPPSLDGNMSRSHSISSGLALMNVEERPDSVPLMTDAYPTTMPWTPPNDLSAVAYTDSPMASTMPSHVRSASYDMSMAGVTWADPTSIDAYSYGSNQVPTPASMASNYFPSPSATPNLRPSAPSKHKSSSGGSGSCTCFTVCLQSLQALHNASSPASPPFDMVLSLNRKAVEGCAAMLACSRCMSRSGTQTAAMLLATVIGKISSFYKNATQSYFENGGTPSTGIGVGVFQMAGDDGRWLELEILARELRKLQEVYAQFKDMCTELSEDPDMSRAMIGYLGQTLGSTLEVVTHRRGDMGYAWR